MNYLEISKQLAKTQQALREYRLQSVLQILANKNVKTQQIQKLEDMLGSELSKKLQSQQAIDDILEELEMLLLKVNVSNY